MSLLARRSILSSAGFIPSNDPLLFSWWDTTDSDNINETSNAVNSFTPTAGSSSVALDQTGGDRPETNTRTQNSRNVIDYDGTGYLKTATTISLPTSGNLMILMACIVDSVSDVDQSLWSLDSTSNDCQLDAANASQFDGELDASGIGAKSGLFTDRPFTGWHIFTIVFDFDNNLYHGYVDAVSQFGAEVYSTKLNTTQDFQTFTNRTEVKDLNGAHADIIITESVDDTTRNAHRGYLENKYAI